VPFTTWQLGAKPCGELMARLRIASGSLRKATGRSQKHSCGRQRH
jgi:hypothetical protein